MWPPFKKPALHKLSFQRLQSKLHMFSCSSIVAAAYESGLPGNQNPSLLKTTIMSTNQTDNNLGNPKSNVFCDYYM